MIHRPLRKAIHGSNRNEVLHYDFLYIPKKETSSSVAYEYKVIIKDDFSGFVELISAASPDLFAVADALMDWYFRFGAPTNHVSDQGSHFKDKVIKEFNRILEVNHHLTTACSP